MKKNLIESWITTILGIGMAGFGGLVFWFDKTPLWGCITIWIIAALFIFADEEAIKKLLDRAPKI